MVCCTQIIVGIYIIVPEDIVAVEINDIATIQPTGQEYLGLTEELPSAEGRILAAVHATCFHL